jgi:tetratricopeptide (TPR) repeat protein
MCNLRLRVIGDVMTHRALVSLAILLLWVPLCMGQTGGSDDLRTILEQAQQAEQKGDYAAAVDAYERALQAHPEIPELWANLGVMQHELRDYADAVVTLQRARNLKPELFVPNLFLGLDYVKIGQPEKAVAYLLVAKKLQPSDPQVPMALARAQFALTHYSAAVEAYSEAIEQSGDSSAAWFGRGISYLEWVEKDAEALSQRDNQSPYAQALFAESLVEQHRDAQAIDAYKAVVIAANRPPCIRGQLGFVYLHLDDLAKAHTEFDAEHESEPGCALADLGMAELSIRHGSMGDALDILQRLWSHDHGFIRSNIDLFMRAMSPPDMKQFADATRTAGEAGRIDQGLFRLLGNPAERSAEGEPDAGVSSTVAAAQISGSPVASAYSTGSRFYASQQYSRCADALDAKLDIATSRTLLLLASCSFFAGRYELTSDAGMLLKSRKASSPEALYWSIRANQGLALRDLARFERLSPDSARAHILLGDAYRQSQRYEDAKAEYHKSLSMSPDDPAALIGLASTMLLDSHADEAVATCREALSYLPNDPEVNLLMGESLLAVREFNQAEPFLKKGLMAKPQMLPHVHALLGRVYAATDRPREAVTELNLGLESDEDGSVHYQLALQYRKLGDEKASQSAMKESEELKLARLQRAHLALKDPAVPFDN